MNGFKVIEGGYEALQPKYFGNDGPPLLVNIPAEPFLDAFLVNLEDLNSNITWRACSLITPAFTLMCSFFVFTVTQ